MYPNGKPETSNCLVSHQIEHPRSLIGKCCCICDLHAPVREFRSKEEKFLGWACVAAIVIDKRFHSPVFFSKSNHGICELFTNKSESKK